MLVAISGDVGVKKQIMGGGMSFRRIFPAKLMNNREMASSRHKKAVRAEQIIK
jgi:hypothetical protein